MSDDYLDLSKSFKGLNPDDHRVNRVLMVGALHDKHEVISSNDRALLRHMLRVFNQWQVPISANLAAFHDYKELPDVKSVRIMNILPEQGGEDFLKSQEKADALMLCNIARDVDDDAIMRPGNMNYLEMPSFLRASFSSSALHRDLDCWQKQIDNTAANFVAVTNTDGFRLAELNNGKFVEVAIPVDRGGSGRCEGMLVRRSYLEDIETYLTIATPEQAVSPLLEIAIDSHENPSRRYRYENLTGKLHAFDGP